MEVVVVGRGGEGGREGRVGRINVLSFRIEGAESHNARVCSSCTEIAFARQVDTAVGLPASIPFRRLLCFWPFLLPLLRS